MGWVVVVLVHGTACAPDSAPVPAPSSGRVGALPTSFEECVRSGGEVEPSERGGRCFSYHTPRADASAYARCRDAGGVSGVRGPGRARAVSGQSHVCTLVFEPAAD